MRRQRLQFNLKEGQEHSELSTGSEIIENPPPLTISRSFVAHHPEWTAGQADGSFWWQWMAAFTELASLSSVCGGTTDHREGDGDWGQNWMSFAIIELSFGDMMTTHERASERTNNTDRRQQLCIQFNFRRRSINTHRHDTATRRKMKRKIPRSRHFFPPPFYFKSSSRSQRENFRVVDVCLPKSDFCGMLRIQRVIVSRSYPTQLR